MDTLGNFLSLPNPNNSRKLFNIELWEMLREHIYSKFSNFTVFTVATILKFIPLKKLIEKSHNYNIVFIRQVHKNH